MQASTAVFGSPTVSPIGGRRSSVPADPAYALSDPLATFGEDREAQTGLFTSRDLGESGLTRRRIASADRSRHSYDSKGSGSRSSGGKRARARKHDSGSIIAAQWLTIFTLVAAFIAYASMGPNTVPPPPSPRRATLRRAAAVEEDQRDRNREGSLPLDSLHALHPEERAEVTQQAAEFAEEKVPTMHT